MTEAKEFMRSLGVDCPDPDALDYGGIIGTVVIRDVIYADRRGRPMLVNGERVMRSKWFDGGHSSPGGFAGPNICAHPLHSRFRRRFRGTLRIAIH